MSRAEGGRRPGLVSPSIALAFSVVLVAYGIMALEAAERSAAHGGGLLGGFGLIPLVLGIALGAVAVPWLLLAWGRR